LPPLSPGASRRGGRGLRDRRSCVAGLAGSGEPTARAESSARAARARLRLPERRARDERRPPQRRERAARSRPWYVAPVFVETRPRRIPRLVDGVDLRALPLTPIEGFVLSRIDGSATVQDLADLTSQDPSEVEATIAKLIGHGAVEWA